MSHTVHPFSHRLGIVRDWKSRWFASDKSYRTFLKADILIREFLERELRSFFVADIQIERNQKAMTLVIKTSRPGMIIGRSGEGITKLRAKLMKLLDKAGINLEGKEFKMDIQEVKNPESNAAIVAMMVAEGLEKRLPFRRVMKQMLEKILAQKEVQGAKIRLGGRLGGTDIARAEDLKKGRIPLQTLRADIDYAEQKAHMTYGNIGIKVWIYKGEIFKKKAETKAGQVASI